MNLVIPGIGTELSPAWASDLNASLSIIDQHNHSPGQGIQIQPNGLNINTDLAFQDNNATLLRSTRFQSQSAVLSGASDLGCLYVVGNELYYNDVTGGHNVQITANGSVNATSSGISSGTASAAFSAGVLVVKSSASSGANVLMQSAVLTNSGNLTNQLTLQAPSLSGSIIQTLPSIPSSIGFMLMDTSGNMSASLSTSGGITSGNIANGTITTTQISSSAGITGGQIANSTITQANLATIPYEISPSSGTASISSGTYASVTNLFVSLTTTGRPVMIFLTGDGTTGTGISNCSLITLSGSNTGYIQILRNGSEALTSQAIVNDVLPGAVSFFDTGASAGTTTYAIQAAVSSGDINFLRCVLVAYEL
jgi:hypothetical protein